MLNAIAHNSSGGKFTDVQTPYNLSEAFSQCLARLLSVAVQEWKVTFEKVNSAIKIVYAGNCLKSSDDGVGSITILFGNLYKKELRKVELDLLLSDVSSTLCADILEISYMYR